MLEKDQEKRVTFDEIVAHPWFHAEEEYKELGFVLGHDVIQADDQVLEELKKYDYDLEYVTQSVELGYHNKESMLYHIIAKMFENKARFQKDARRSLYNRKDTQTSFLTAPVDLRKSTSNISDISDDRSGFILPNKKWLLNSIQKERANKKGIISQNI